MRVVAAIEVIGAVAGIVPRPVVAGSAAALCRRLLRVDVRANVKTDARTSRPTSNLTIPASQCERGNRGHWGRFDALADATCGLRQYRRDTVIISHRYKAHTLTLAQTYKDHETTSVAEVECDPT